MCERLERFLHWYDNFPLIKDSFQNWPCLWPSTHLMWRYRWMFNCYTLICMPIWNVCCRLICMPIWNVVGRHSEACTYIQSLNPQWISGVIHAFFKYMRLGVLLIMEHWDPQPQPDTVALSRALAGAQWSTQPQRLACLWLPNIGRLSSCVCGRPLMVPFMNCRVSCGFYRYWPRELTRFFLWWQTKRMVNWSVSDCRRP